MTERRVNPPEKIRIEGDRKTAIETGRNCLMVAGALFGAAFLVISIRVVDVLIFSSEAEPRYSRSITKTEKIYRTCRHRGPQRRSLGNQREHGIALRQSAARARPRTGGAKTVPRPARHQCRSN